MSKKGQRNTPWSSEDTTKLKAMIDQGVTQDQMAIELRRSRSAVSTKIPALRRTEGKGDVRRRKQRRNNGASFFLS